MTTGSDAADHDLDGLAARFHQAAIRIYERARDEVNYVASRFLSMVSEHGGLGAARILLASPDVSDGYTRLWEAGRLDLSVDFHALMPEFAPLFTEEEMRVARERLLAYGMKAEALRS